MDWFTQANQLMQTGRAAEAEAAYRKALELNAAHPESRNNLGVLLQSLGRLDEAAAEFAEATRLRPSYADAWENRAGVLLALGRHDDAIAAAREMVRHLPKAAGSHIVLATALARSGRLDDGAAACEAGLGIERDNPNALYCLANIRAAQQRWPEAADAFTKVVSLCPTAIDAHVNLGVSLAAGGRLEEAAARFRTALERDGNCADAALRLADVLDRLGQHDEALAAAQNAARLRPDDVGTLNLLASLYDRSQKPADAMVYYRRTLELDANHAPALANYATLLARRGEIERAVPMLRRAVEVEPGDAVAHSSLCMYLNAMPGAEPREIFAEHRRWARRHAEPLLTSEISNLKSQISSSGRLRIGYVSPDWAGHPVARFMQPILESHDRAAFEIHVYDDAAKPDAFTDRLRPCVDAWHRVRGMPDAQLAAKIREDGMDVLVDLAGHTADNRLLVFARKPAPVRVSYLGYPATTGLEAIDYRLTDAIADPPGVADELHSERLVRLPETFLCFRPPVETPAVSEPPMVKNGYVTFGSFNALWKINTPLLQLWSRVLAAVPNSRLLLKASGLEDHSVADRIAGVFKEAGIARERLQLLGREHTYAGHLGAYAACDVCLDTFPYAGTTTTCEALWMGVPVISLLGQTHASRVGASLLGSIGLQNLATDRLDGFVEIASQLPSDADRLRQLRFSMREKMGGSALMNAITLTRAIESAYKEMCGFPRHF